MTQDRDEHARQNARAWAETIMALVSALEADYDRLQELRDERSELAAAVKEAEDGRQEKDRHAAQVQLNEWDAAYGAELTDLEEAVTVDGDKMEDADKARERVTESALDVSVRGPWYSPGQAHEALTPEEFQVLLTTGGPALRIMGELDEHGQPRRAWLEYQDWGTAWTEYHGEGAPAQETLLTFCSAFYFGE